MAKCAKTTGEIDSLKFREGMMKRTLESPGAHSALSSEVSRNQQVCFGLKVNIRLEILLFVELLMKGRLLLLSLFFVFSEGYLKRVISRLLSRGSKLATNLDTRFSVDMVYPLPLQLPSQLRFNYSIRCKLGESKEYWSKGGWDRVK